MPLQDNDPPPLRSYALPVSPCRSPTGSDNMSVWVEEVSDGGEPRVRVARSDSPRRHSDPGAIPKPSSPVSVTVAVDVDAASLPPPPSSVTSPVSAADTMDFPLVLVGTGDDAHGATTHTGAMSAAIVPFQKLQMDTNLHQTTLPTTPTNKNQSTSTAGSPSNNTTTRFSAAFHSQGASDAMSQNFMEAMRLGGDATAATLLRPQEPQLSVRLRGSRVELASASEDDAVDFLGPAENIKKLFKLPYSQGRVSLAVHRVGSTLVVDGGIDDVDLPPGFGDDDDDRSTSAASAADHAQQPFKTIEAQDEQQSQQLLYEKFIYQSTLVGRLTHDEDQTDQPTATKKAKHHVLAPQPRHQRRHGKSKGKNKSTEKKPSPAATGASSSSFGFENSQRRAPPSRSSSASSSASASSAFQRVLKWKFNDLKMILGSDVLLFSNPEHPAVSLRLHDMDKELSLATVLDYYLDNVIANIPELGICMHSKGVVRGYKLVETRQIPYMSGDAARPLFDVQEVSMNASMLLKFLKENCTRPNGTYWLHRRQGEDALRLYDVNVLSQGKQLKWKYMMAMLCYRFASRASRMMFSLTAETPRLQKQLRHRQRDLLRTCVNLLQEIADAGGAAHKSIRSSVAEQLADTYLRQGDDDDDVEEEVNEKNTDTGGTVSKADALVQAKTYLEESIRLFEECIQAESEATALPTAQSSSETETAQEESDELTTGSFGGGGDDDDGDDMNGFMKEELLRLQLKRSSICLQLAHVRIRDQTWDAVVACIRDAAQQLPPAAIPTLRKPLLVPSALANDGDDGDDGDEIDALFAAIDFSGVRQKDDPFYGGNAARDANARVCASGAELRCFLLEIIGDAASKASVPAPIASELVEVFKRVSGEKKKTKKSKTKTSSACADPLPCGQPQLALATRQLAFSSYLRALFPAVDSELYFRLMKKLGNACNELGKHFLSTTPRHAVAFRWFERGCRVFRDIEDSVNVALLSANLAHLHKILAQQQQLHHAQQHHHYARAVQLCLDAASLLKHHKLDEDAALHRKVTGELALSYLVWGVALASTASGVQHDKRDAREADAQKKFSKALALYTELGDVKQGAATHYQIASFHARQIARDVEIQHRHSSKDASSSLSKQQSSGLKNRMEIARRHYEKALEYFGRVEILGATFVLIHQELADLYAMGGRLDDLDHALLVLLNTVHALQSAVPNATNLEPLAINVVAKIQTTLHQLIRLSATMATPTHNVTVSVKYDDAKAKAKSDAYKLMYKEMIYFNAAASSALAACTSSGVASLLTTLQSIYDATASASL